MADLFEAKVKRLVGTPTGWTERKMNEMIGDLGVSVLDFGAVPDGSTDNYAAFINAGDYLLSRGGGILYVPGTVGSANSYNFATPLNFQNCANATNNRFVYMMGDGALDLNGSRLTGSFPGQGVLEHHYGQQILRGVSRLGFINGSERGYGVVWNGTHVGQISQCRIFAVGVGIVSNNESYQLAIEHCDIYGSANRGIGVMGGQVSLRHSSIVGWDIGARFFNAGSNCDNCRFEVNRTGLQLGCTFDAIFTATISGTTMTTTNTAGFIYNLTDHGVVNLITGSYEVPQGIVYVIDQLTGTAGGDGTYQISHSLTRSTPFTALTGSISVDSGLSAHSLSFERNDTGIDCLAVGGCAISGVMISGTVGTGRPVSNITWASGGGGVATVTTTDPHYQSGTFSGFIDSSNPSGYNVFSTAMTVTGANTFTYPLAVDPGSYVGGAQWSPEIQYGMRVRAASGLAVCGMSISAEAETAGLDLTYDGNTSAGGVDFVGLSISGGPIIAPPSNQKATIMFDGNPAFILNFNELPGQAGGPAGWTASEGMEYNITDGNTTTFGATAAGGGANNIKVRYNGANWTCMGA